MRLFLSSYKFGNQPEKLLSMLSRSDARVAIITNASDNYSDTEIVEHLYSTTETFKDMGLASERLDLRNYFKKDSSKLLSKLREFDMVWVKGGNAFILRRAMAQSGFDEIITHMLANDEIIYGGYSAGVCVLAPSLIGVDLVDDPDIVPAGYESEVIWDGLGLIDYTIVPHYKSDYSKSAMVDDVVELLERSNYPFKTLQDGQAILINDEYEEILG